MAEPRPRLGRDTSAERYLVEQMKDGFRQAQAERAQARAGGPKPEPR